MSVKRILLPFLAAFIIVTPSFAGDIISCDSFENCPDGSVPLTNALLALEARLDALEAENNALKTLLADVSRGTDPNTGQDTLRFTGMNVQIVSGSGSTDGDVTGTGNLIIGYNEKRGTDNDRSGSHMLVVGSRHNYSSYGGMVVGYWNTASGPLASVSGGFRNTASGQYSSVSGGDFNTASFDSASVSGGSNNRANGHSASVSGGQINTASGQSASVSGGEGNTASGYWASVSGGQSNTASGQAASVLGGIRNDARGTNSTVFGGSDVYAWSSVDEGVYPLPKDTWSNILSYEK